MSDTPADARPWSEDEQRALDQALAALLPATFADPRERWSAISARVEGRSLKECVARYKELRALLSQRGPAPAAAAPPLPAPPPPPPPAPAPAPPPPPAPSRAPAAADPARERVERVARELEAAEARLSELVGDRFLARVEQANAAAAAAPAGGAAPAPPPAREKSDAEKAAEHDVARLRHALALAQVGASDPKCRLLALEFEREVGRGSYGEVSAVRATHARGSSGPLLALKRVACRDARQQREVLAELSAVQSVRHAGVVRMCGRAGRGLSLSPRCLE